MRINDKFKVFAASGIIIFFLSPIYQAGGEVYIKKEIIGKWERYDPEYEWKETIGFFKEGTISAFCEDLEFPVDGDYRFIDRNHTIIDSSFIQKVSVSKNGLTYEVNKNDLFFRMPVNPKDDLKKYFQYNVSAERYQNKVHAGIDLETTGRLVITTAPGKVVLVQTLDHKNDKGLGNTVIIEHELEEGDKIYSLYAHLETIKSDIRKETKVSANQAIGIMGTSGYGELNFWEKQGQPIHLHFEIKEKPVLGDPKTNTHWGYVPSEKNPNDYGYRNPYDFFGKKRVKSAPLQKPEATITRSLLITPAQTIYQVGDNLTAEFTIANKGNAPITFDILTVGGRLNGECPQDKCPDFEWKIDVPPLQPKNSYDYKGELKLEAPGNYHFFTTYRTKDGWKTAIPTAPGISNTKDIDVKLLTEKNDETYPDLQEWLFGDAQNVTLTAKWNIQGKVWDGLLWHSLHTGIDYGAPEGTPVYSATEGIVINVVHGTDCDKLECLSTVAIYNKATNVTFIYLHMKGIKVKMNQEVKAGVEIGLIGQRGPATDPHLHFEARPGKKLSAALDVRNTINPYEATKKARVDTAMRILFVGKERGDSQFDYHLFAINPDGTGKYEIPLNYGFLPDITISPDKKKFALPYRGGIVIINIRGEKLKTLAFPKGMKFLAPADLRWSPDGTRIAFDDIGQANIRNSNIYVIYAENGNLLRLTQAKELVWDLFATWTPDSKQIMFNRAIGSTNKFKTYIIDADGTGQEKMIKDLLFPEFSRDGGMLAFVDLHAKVTVATYKGFNEDIEIKDVKQLANFVKDDSRVGRIRWFPDGTRIAFSDGYGEFFVVNVGGSNLQEIPVNMECRLIECVKDF